MRIAQINHRARNFVTGLSAVVLCIVSSMATAEVLQISTNEQLQQLIDENVPVVDLRTPEEWKATGIISGSELLTFFKSDGSYDVRTWMSSFVDVAQPADKVILICAVGNRSMAVSSFLKQQFGYDTVYNVTKGIDFWIRGGKPVEPWPP